MKKSIMETAKGINIPDRYELGSADITELIHMAKDFDGMFNALWTVYKIGFKRGRSYEKRHGERG